LLLHILTQNFVSAAIGPIPIDSCPLIAKIQIAIVTGLKPNLYNKLRKLPYVIVAHNHSGPSPFVYTIITFRVSRRRREMYIGHARLCVCLSVSVRCCMSILLHGPGRNLENGRGAFWLYTIGRICNRCTGFVAMAK